MVEVDVQQAFRDSRSEDIVDRITAWGALERIGLAKIYVVGGRFVNVSLTDEGEKIRKVLEEPTP